MHLCSSLFFFNDTATTEIYTLSLHDALPIFRDALGDERGARRFHHRADEVVEVADLRFGEHRIGFFARPLLEQLQRSEEHTSELQSQSNLVCRLLLEKKKKTSLCIHQSVLTA